MPCEQAMNGSTVLVGKQRDTAPSRGLVDFVRLDRLYCCVSESLHLGSFFFSFFFWSLFSKLILFTSYLLRIVVAEIREMWNFLYPFWNCLVFLSLLDQDYNFLWVETPNALSLFFFFTLKRTLGYYYGNDQNTTKTIKSRQWLCSNCQLYTFHSVLYVFSERRTGYLMPPYAIAIHSSGSVLQEWWSAPKASLVERSYLFLCLFDKDEHWKIWFSGLKYDNRLGTKEIKYSR